MGPLRVLVIGAHPDDCDIRAAGIAALYEIAGHSVRFLSMTNGDAGHHEIGGMALAGRRKQEAQKAAGVIGIDYVVLDNHDGELTPSLERRREMIKLIRAYDPHVVMTHRPNDYHPDHRYTSQIVQDASYLVTVPNIVPLTPYLAKKPVIMYLEDSFRRPYPFHPDIVVDIGSVIDKKIAMLDAHKSQFYEWLPFNKRERVTPPRDDNERRRWLKDSMAPRFSVSDLHKAKLAELYGPKRAASIKYVEAFEVSEYGSPLTDDNRDALFPFFK